MAKRVLEVERKFSRLLVYPLTKSTGSPAFNKLEYCGRTSFHDRYFDLDNRLSSAGLWVRKRNGQWQSKLRKGGDHRNSQFQESHNLIDIRALVAAATGLSQDLKSDFGLTALAAFTTMREAWKADSKFNIVLDTTDFGHTVGEVELEQVLDGGSEEQANALCSEMDAELVRFMKRYEWVFDTDTEPVGKLTAYFNSRHRIQPFHVPGGVSEGFRTK